MKRIPAPLLAVLLPALAAAAGAGPARADGAVLEGRVRTEDGAALAGAHVYASRDAAVVAESETDEGGRFRVEVPAGGPVDVRVGKASSEPWDGERLRWFALDAVREGVVPGQGEVDLVASRDAAQGVLRVRVTSPEGYVAHAMVDVRPACFPRQASSWWPTKGTNAIGRADCKDLPLLPADVRVERQAPWCPARVREVMPDPLGVDLCRIELERERFLEGRVCDAAGVPVPGLGVLAVRAGAGSARAWGDLTGRDGEFEIGVPASWERATLLVGCDLPEEDSPHRLVLEIDTTEHGAKNPVDVTLVGAPAPADAPADDETRRVMETVLRAHDLDGSRGCIVLERQLSMRLMEGPLSKYLGPEVQASTQRDLERRLRHPATLPAGLDLGLRQIVIDAAWSGYLEQIHDRNFWRHFYQRFPCSNGIVSLSCVGFSDDGTQAVVHVVHWRWIRNGDGHYCLLEKRDGRWHIVKRVMTWVS